MPDRLILISDSHILFSVDYSVDSPVATEIHFPSVEDESYDVWAEILGSCNGLVLALNESDVAMYLLNPSTRESKKIPESPFALNSVNACNLCGLGYDSMSDDFKIVMLSYYGGGVDEESGATTETNTIVSVYSLKSYSWRKIQGSSYLHCASDPSGVYLNGCIHWLAQRSSDYISVIVAFDLGNEVFREFLPPPFVNNAVLPWFYPAVLGGYLCLPAFTDVWVMKEYGKKESWTKFSICKREDISRIDVVCLLEDGEFLLSRDEEQLVAYNSKDETSRDMVVCGIPGSFTSGGTYVESLISPERIHGIGRQCEACERMKRILQVMVETYEAGTCQSSTNKESSSSSNIEAPTSSSGGDRASLSICLHFLKFIQMVEGPFYEKALRMFQDPLWRKLFINMACEKKMF